MAGAEKPAASAVPSPDQIREWEEKYLFPTYRRAELYLDRGRGTAVYDLAGRRYLDFLSGIAVTSLGHAHPRLVRILQEQGERLLHCSNLFYHPFQGQLAKRLAEVSGMSRAFFTNSGTEAIEAALKVARAYPRTMGQTDKPVLLSLPNSFHGRTLGALAITAQEKYQAPFRPLVPEVRVVEEISVAALERSFDSRVCALVMEPIQGEGGVRPLPEEFFRAARELCDRYEALLVLDEIQCGLGRTGKWFAFQHYDVQPDLLTLAKSLASGYPLGVVLGNEKVGETLQPGTHGTTFGGGPLACRIALEVLAILEQESLIERAEEVGDYFKGLLEDLASRHPAILEVRGMGLMLGVELGDIAKEVVKRLLERGFIANAAHETVLRILPPLIVEKTEIADFVQNLDAVLDEIETEKSHATRTL